MQVTVQCLSFTVQCLSLITKQVQLWTEDSCICPKIYTNREYVVMCYQDLYNGRLLLQDDCLVEEWSADDWPRLVKVRFALKRGLNLSKRLFSEPLATTIIFLKSSLRENCNVRVWLAAFIYHVYS